MRYLTINCCQIAEKIVHIKFTYFVVSNGIHGVMPFKLINGMITFAQLIIKWVLLS
jgi:hypothetical protein